MKKTLLMFFLAATTLTTLAQDKKPTFGLLGNLNVAYLSTTYDNSTAVGNTGSLASFSVGAFADLKVSEKFSIQPALLYTGKGGKISEEGTSVKARLNYLQVPLNVVYHAPASYGEYTIGLGPYIGYGLSANITLSQGGSSLTQDVGFGDTEEEYKRIDAGLDLFVRLQLKNKLIFSIGSDLGLSNISNQSGQKTMNRVSSIGIGYAF